MTPKQERKNNVALYWLQHLIGQYIECSDSTPLSVKYAKEIISRLDLESLSTVIFNVWQSTPVEGPIFNPDRFASAIQAHLVDGLEMDLIQ